MIPESARPVRVKFGLAAQARSLPGVTLQLLPFPAAEYPAWRELQVERRRRWQFGPLWLDDAAAAERARSAVEQLAPTAGLSGTHLHRVLDDDREAGWIWLARHPGDLLVLDAHVDAAAGQLLGLLEVHARAGDADLLLLDRMVGAPTLDALAAAGGFTPAASNMVLELGERPAASEPGPAVRLRPMTEESFAAYLVGAIDEYAQEIHESTGATLEEALVRAGKEYDELLPRGLASDGQVLFDVVETAGARVVGVLWLGLRPPSAAFVYDVHLHPEHRGRGLGRATMRAAAAWCRDARLGVLGLNVFGQNTVARRRYDSEGYRVVVEELRRPLPPAPPVTGPR
jgi:GNAT superfamily N-acetyltransferase